MNNKMAIRTYLSMIESKTWSKWTSRTETDLQIQRIFLQLPDGRDLGEIRDIGEGIEKYKLVVTE